MSPLLETPYGHCPERVKCSAPDKPIPAVNFFTGYVQNHFQESCAKAFLFVFCACSGCGSSRGAIGWELILQKLERGLFPWPGVEGAGSLTANIWSAVYKSTAMLSSSVCRCRARVQKLLWSVTEFSNITSNEGLPFSIIWLFLCKYFSSTDC